MIITIEREKEANVALFLVVVQVQVTAKRDAVVAGVHSGPVVAVHFVVDGWGNGVAHDHCGNNERQVFMGEEAKGTEGKRGGKT